MIIAQFFVVLHDLSVIHTKASRNAHDALCLLKDEIQIDAEPTVIDMNKRKKSKTKRLNQNSSPILQRDTMSKHSSIQKTVIEKTISSDAKSKNWEPSEVSKTSLIQSISADPENIYISSKINIKTSEGDERKKRRKTDQRWW
uniref:Uncharacterized protein n=1 Tax=Octopus bimaculoides TaxID=37653 RepID=A0A0L8HC52_OCTBM